MSRPVHAPLASGGFTLLEMLVALAIFSLLAAMSYGGLQAVMTQQSVTEEAADRLGELQKLYLLMQRDLEQVVPRPIRDEFGDTQPPLIGNERLQLTRGGWPNPAGRPRSTLQRVAYAFEEDRLVRYSWMVLDRAQDSVPLVQPLTDAIESLQIRYLGTGEEWQEQWPPEAAVLDPGAEPVGLPRLVEVTLEHKSYGPIVWLFQLPQ